MSPHTDVAALGFGQVGWLVVAGTLHPAPHNAGSGQDALTRPQTPGLQLISPSLTGYYSRLPALHRLLHLHLHLLHLLPSLLLHLLLSLLLHLLLSLLGLLLGRQGRQVLQDPVLLLPVLL